MSPTISGESDHDADLGCTRANLRTRSLRAGIRRGSKDRGVHGQVRDLRDHLRDRICDPLHGVRAAQLAAFHLSPGRRESGLLDARGTERGRPAHVLVWLGLPRRASRPRRGLGRRTDAAAAASGGDLFLLHSRNSVADRVLFTDGTTFNEQWATWALWSGLPAFVGAAALTYFAGPAWAERMWTNWLVVMPIGGLIILGYSLKTFFLR